jgi:hypothetical protein
MKVVGTGAPRTLTVRVQTCEIGLWREALRRRLTAATDRGEAARAAEDVESMRRDEAGAIARLLERAHAPVPSGQPWVLSGPSLLLADVIHGIAGAALEGYAAAWRRFIASPDARNGDQLRIAVDAAAATTATAIALARVQDDAA